MPTLNDLRTRLSSSDRTSRFALSMNETETFVSDQRGRLTPKEVVDTKLGHALAREEGRLLVERLATSRRA